MSKRPPIIRAFLGDEVIAVIDSDATMPADHVVHRIRWYRRDQASAGIKSRGRR